MCRATRASLTYFVVPPVHDVPQLHYDGIATTPYNFAVLCDSDDAGSPERVHRLAPVAVQVADCSMGRALAFRRSSAVNQSHAIVQSYCTHLQSHDQWW